jgi:ABC-type uncharacterized transport system fused permease/ATPase subunit
MLRCGSSFAEILLLGKSVQEIAGYARRIAELLEALPRHVVPVPFPSAGGEAKSDQPIVFEGVEVGAPEPGGKVRTLVRDLNLRVRSGTNVLVTGPNGCGKTSLFRVLAGLWAPVAGQVTRPNDFIMWLPQDPYLVTGTLRDQVTYPKIMGMGDHADAKVDAQVMACLALAGLTSIATRSPLGLDQVHAATTPTGSPRRAVP